MRKTINSSLMFHWLWRNFVETENILLCNLWREIKPNWQRFPAHFIFIFVIAPYLDSSSLKYFPHVRFSLLFKNKKQNLCSLSHWSLFYSPNIRKHPYKTLFGCNQIVTKSYVNINFMWYKSVSIDLFILSLFYHLWNNVLCCYHSFQKVFINF